MFNYKYQLEHIFSFGAALESPPEAIGPVAEGIRVNFYSQGGEVTGPKLQGRCRSVGGDWLTIRTDGVAILGLDHRIGHFRPCRMGARWLKRLTMRTSWRSSVAPEVIEGGRRHDRGPILDVRTTLESHDGALIAITYSGVADIGDGGYQRFLEGNLPARLTLHVVPRCQTAHPGYLWLNRVLSHFFL
jgi:hypothetical protein